MAGSVVAGLGLAPDGGAWARESLLCQGWDWAGGGDTGGGRMEFCNFDSDTTLVYIGLVNIWRWGLENPFFLLHACLRFYTFQEHFFRDYHN